MRSAFYLKMLIHTRLPKVNNNINNDLMQENLTKAYKSYLLQPNYYLNVTNSPLKINNFSTNRKKMIAK
jgi:hypothetical protein